MARPTVADLFDQVRDYLDTDELNMPDVLLDQMLQRVWFEAVNMEIDWRFLTRTYNVAVLAGQDSLPMAFTDKGSAPDTPATPAVRIEYVALTNGAMLQWVPLQEALTRLGQDSTGSPCYWTEHTRGVDRLLLLLPAAWGDVDVTISFYAAPVYPPVDSLTGYSGTFADLPDEFDQALKVGLTAEAYMREEDPELYDAQRQIYLEAMGSIRNRWRRSDTQPLVMNRSPFGRSDDRMAVGRLPNGF